jgi:hypothetical protein
MSKELGPSIQTTTSLFFSEPVPDQKPEVSFSSNDDSDYQLIQKEFEAMEPLKTLSETKESKNEIQDATFNNTKRVNRVFQKNGSYIVELSNDPRIEQWIDLSNSEESKTEVHATPYGKARRLMNAIKQRNTKNIIELTNETDVQQWINLRNSDGAHAGYYALNPPNVALFKRLLSRGLDLQTPLLMHVSKAIRFRDIGDQKLTEVDITIQQESIEFRILRNSIATQSKLLAVINQHYGISFSTAFFPIQNLEYQFYERNHKLQELTTAPEIISRNCQILLEKSRVYNAVVKDLDYETAAQFIKNNSDFLFQTDYLNSYSHSFSGEENYPDLFSQLFVHYKTSVLEATKHQIKALLQTIIDSVSVEKLNRLYSGRALIHHLVLVPELEDLFINLCKKPGINLNLHAASYKGSHNHDHPPLYDLLLKQRHAMARQLIDLGGNLHDCYPNNIETLWSLNYPNKKTKLEAAVLILDAYGNRPEVDPWIYSHGYRTYNTLAHSSFPTQQHIMRDVSLEHTPSFIINKLIQHLADPCLMYPRLEPDIWHPPLHAETSSRLIEIFSRCLIVRDSSLINQPLYKNKTIYHWLVLHSKEYKWKDTDTETLVLLLLANKTNYQDFYKCAQQENNHLVVELLQKHKPFVKLPFTIASNPIYFETDFHEDDNINPFVVDAKRVRSVFSSHNKLFTQIKAPKILNRSNAVQAFREGFKFFMNNEFSNALPCFLKAAALDRHPYNYLYLGIVLHELHSKPETHHPLYPLFADHEQCQQQSNTFFTKMNEQYKEFLKASSHSALAQFHLGMFYKYVRKIDLAAEETLAEAGKRGFAFAYYYIATHPIEHTPVMHYLKSAANLGLVVASAQLETYLEKNASIDAAVSITTTQSNAASPHLFNETKSDARKSEVSVLSATDQWSICNKAHTIKEIRYWLEQALTQNPAVNETLLPSVHFSNAESFFKSCSDKDNLQLYDEVGAVFAQGDLQKKIEWHKVAANAGDAESNYFLGYHYLHQHHFSLAKEYLTKAQQSGHTSATKLLEFGLHNYLMVEHYPQFDFFQRKPKAETKEEGILLELGL